MSNFRDLIARMAIDPEFARHTRANPDAVARQYQLSSQESEQLRGLADAAASAGPTALGARLSKMGGLGAMLGSPLFPGVDTDGDGLPNWLDPDDDNDGIPDHLDPDPLHAPPVFDPGIIIGPIDPPLVLDPVFPWDPGIIDPGGDPPAEPPADPPADPPAPPAAEEPAEPSTPDVPAPVAETAPADAGTPVLLADDAFSAPQPTPPAGDGGINPALVVGGVAVAGGVAAGVVAAKMFTDKPEEQH